MAHSQLTFRAQLATPEQRDVYDYWLERVTERALPGRPDIRPADLRHVLPGLSLYDVERDPLRCRVRLAGTSLRDVYDRELTGKYLDEISFGPAETYWRAAYDRVARRGLPAQGVTTLAWCGKDHILQCWLRLPLSNDGRHIDMILGLDSFVHVEKAGRLLDRAEVLESA